MYSKEHLFSKVQCSQKQNGTEIATLPGSGNRIIKSHEWLVAYLKIIKLYEHKHKRNVWSLCIHFYTLCVLSFCYYSATHYFALNITIKCFHQNCCVAQILSCAQFLDFKLYCIFCFCFTKMILYISWQWNIWISEIRRLHFVL